MSSNKKYTPIPCGFYDYLEHFATLRKPVTLTYSENEEIIVLKNQVILDLSGGRAGEFIHLEQLNEKQLIRMDHIISIDGILMADYKTTECNNN